jgi:hypothetical protein
MADEQTKYISQDDAEQFICAECERPGCPILWGGNCDRIDRLNAIPAADVRPVVTCGKCKYGKYTGTSWFCDKHSGHADKFGEDASYHEYHSKHWFCADGEERNHA